MVRQAPEATTMGTGEAEDAEEERKGEKGGKWRKRETEN